MIINIWTHHLDTQKYIIFHYFKKINYLIIIFSKFSCECVNIYDQVFSYMQINYYTYKSQLKKLITK